MSLLATTGDPVEIPASSAAPAPAPAAQRRLEPLDVLRGLTVVLMILVNTSGGPANGYRLPRHRRI
jgi:predicted acyltransferase